MISELRQMAITEWLMIVLTWTVLWAIEVSNVFHGYSLVVLQVLAVLFVSGRFHALGVILHDAVHSRASKQSASWRFQILCAYPIATTLEAMRYHHLRHHDLYGTESDPYLNTYLNKYLKRAAGASTIRLAVAGSIFLTFIKASVLVPVWIIRPLVALLAGTVPSVRTFYQKALLQDRERDCARNLVAARELEECLNAENRQLVFWLLLVGTSVGLASTSVIKATTILAFYFLPLWLAGFVNVWRVLFEHDHSYRRIGTAGQEPRQVWQSTKTLSLAGFNWLFAPRNIGYHQAHHLFPAVGLKKLPELHRRLFLDRNYRVIDDPMPSVPIAKSSN